LGLVQGLTEFIPVSSTAHLILAPDILGIARPRAEIAHTYDTFIQIGTVIPVLIYFWRDWLNLLRAALRILQQRRIGDDLNERLVKYLLLGSIPAGVAGLLLEKHIERLAEPATFPPAYLIIGIGLIGMALVMWWVERISRKVRTLENLQMPDAWVVGFAQALALFPGVSRSGSTITAGLLTGLTREAAARFSFLLMTPVMLAATGYKALKLLRGSEQLTSGEWSGMLLATVVAGITGYVAIAFLLRFLRTRSLGWFAGYRIAVGAFCIGLFFMQQGGTAPAGSGATAAPALQAAPGNSSAVPSESFTADAGILIRQSRRGSER
jgi:undecaprenyl-diphosphatase